MTENNLLKKLNRLNPNIGKPYKNYTEKIDNKIYYRIYSWMFNVNNPELKVTEDKLTSFSGLRHCLKKIDSNFSNQLYFDIVSLGITEINQRPCCTICGKPNRFISLTRGYKLTCSNSCLKKFRQSLMDDNHKLLKNRPVSDITRAKLRAAKKGKLLLDLL